MKRILALLALAFVFSCSPDQKEKAILNEAHELQQKTIKGLSELEDYIDAESPSNKDSLEHIIHELEENLFAIPGYELTLPGHEGHDHGHSRPSLTNEEILVIQKELYKQVQSIQTTINTHD